MNVEVATAKTSTFSMDYCAFGAGAGTLVVLPGLSVQSVMPQAGSIARAYDALTRDYAVYILDRKKGPLPEAYTVREMADDTAEALRALGLEGVDVFGASQGGMMALELAIRHQELVRRLVVGSTSCRIDSERFGLFDAWAQLARSGDALALHLEFGRAILPKKAFEGARAALARAAESTTGADLARFASMVEGMRGFDIADDLKRISCPVLVIGASDDGVLGGEASELIARNLTGSTSCELHMYDGYGHAAYDLAPDYKERMLAFLKGRPARTMPA